MMDEMETEKELNSFILRPQNRRRNKSKNKNQIEKNEYIDEREG